MSVCFILDTLWQSRGKQLCSNLWSTVRVLTLPLSSLFFVLLLFHSSHSSPLASQCDSIYLSRRGSAACLGGRCDEVKNFHTGVQILSGPVRDMAPHMHRDPEGTDLMRTPEWGYYNELFSVLALGKHPVTTLALLEVHRDLIFWPRFCETKNYHLGWKSGCGLTWNCKWQRLGKKQKNLKHVWDLLIESHLVYKSNNQIKQCTDWKCIKTVNNYHEVQMATVENCLKRPINITTTGRYVLYASNHSATNAYQIFYKYWAYLHLPLTVKLTVRGIYPSIHFQGTTTYSWWGVLML